MAAPAATFLEFTPPANRRKAGGPKEDDVPLVLVLAPFNPPAKLFFEETKIQELHSKTIIVRNPTSSPIFITLDKCPDPTSGLSVSAAEFCVEACSQYLLTVIWQAVTSESFRHIIHVKDGRRNKKISEIIVTATCVSPVKKKSRFCTKKFAPLRAKIISNKVCVTSPKASAPRPPLKRKSPLTATTENFNTFQEKDLKAVPDHAPITPRRQTFDVENKENSDPPSKRKSKKIPASGFRDTLMKPPPMFSTQRKRRVLNETASLEIEKCFSHKDVVLKSNQTAVSMEPPPMLSSQRVLNKTVSLEIEKSLSQKDDLLKPNQADNQRTQLRRSTFSLDSPGSKSLSTKAHLSSVSPLSNRSAQNENKGMDRLSIDSLNAPESVNLSSESSDVFVMARDSLEANSNLSSPSSGINYTAENSKSSQNIKPQNTLVIPESNPNLTHVIKKKRSLSNDKAKQSDSQSAKNRLNFSPTGFSGKAYSSSPHGIEDSSSSGVKADELFSPINFSPSYDLKRCTFVKEEPCTPLGKSNCSPNFSEAAEPNLSPRHNLKRSTYSKDDPCTPLFQSSISDSPIPCNLSFTIINDDDCEEAGDSFYDLKLKTPQAVTNNNGEESFRNLRLTTPQTVPKENETYSFFNIKLRTPKIDSSPYSLKNPQKSSRKRWALPSPNFSTSKISDLCDRPTVLSELQKADDFEGSKINVHSESSQPSPNHSQIIKESQIMACPRFSEVASSTCSVNDKLLQRKPSKVSVSALNEDIESNFVAPERFSHHLKAKSEISLPMSSLISNNTQNDILTPKQKPASPMFIEISPPSRHLAKADLNTHNLVFAKPKSKFKSPRILANSITVKTVISPSLKTKRLTSTICKSNITLPRSLTSSCLTAKPGTPKVSIVDRAFSSARKLPRTSTSKIRSVSFTGVPMSTLKLKTVTGVNPKAVVAAENKRNVESSSSQAGKLAEKTKQANQFETKKSVLFRNPDQYIKSLSQPAEYLFLFSSTSQVDPFMTNSLYYDPEWLDRQETDLIKWLNSLLTPPAELEADSAGLWRVDVASLWRKSQAHSKVELAQSRETVSSQYLLKKDRLDLVRKAASTLFCSDSIAPVFSKLAVSINKKVLSIRDDRDLHLDRGLQCKVLSLLLCYNPLWLRIGLETIYGRTIALHSNSDVVGLTSFIHKNLLSDSYLKKKHSHMKVPSLYLPSFADAMKKFTLRKFFMLVYFLDQAKTRKLIRHDPCLFVTNSPYKESRELVIEFTKDLVAGLSDINKYLRTFGYVLQHKQTYLDEFNYAVSSRQDLRDGVRLTRVMEIILSVHSLSTKLRTPAISRLQKVHNVDVALRALQSAGYAIQGDIKSKDIVDGHREKTLSLLWQIIYRFQAPRYEKAAIRLQEWWKKNSLRFEIFKRIRAKRLAQQNKAATKIQALWRGFISRVIFQNIREKLMKEKEERTNAAIIIQKQWRRLVAQKAFNSKKSAALKLQKWYRMAKTTQSCRCAFIQKRNAALVIQRHYRAKKMMKDDRNYYQSLKAAVLKMQQRFRQIRITKKTRKEYLALRLATLFVQSKYLAKKLMCIEREKFVVLRKKVVFIQQSFRAKIEGRKCRQSFSDTKAATIFIQRTFRKNKMMKLERSKYMSLRETAIIIQRRFRGNKLMQTQQSHYKALRSSAIFMQNHFRANRMMKICRNNFVSLKNAATTLQLRFRANLQATKARTNYIKLKQAVTFIQAKYRAKKAMQQDRRAFLKLRHAALYIQRKFIANKLSCKHRLEYSELKKATSLIQAKFRAVQSMKRDHKHYVALRQSALIIQKRYRAKKAMQHDRAAFLKLKSAAICIQRKFIAKKLSSEFHSNYLELKKATLFIQAKYRASKRMKCDCDYYLALKQSAIVFQRRYRAKREMERCRQDFLKLKSSVITIQSLFKARLLARKTRLWFVTLRGSVINIQIQWRRKKLMERQQNDFLQLRHFTILMQRKLRANKIAKKCLGDFTALKDAVKLVQNKFRANKAMKVQRKTYLSLRQATIKIQQRFRAKNLAKECLQRFTKLKTAIVFIQQTFRKNKVMKETRSRYLNLKHATLVIQRRFRANLKMKAQRKKYLELKLSAITIQSHYRAMCMMRTKRSAFLRLKNATLVIQNRYRAHIIAKNTRENYDRLRQSTIYLQTKYRAKKAMESCRTEYLKLKNATVFVQRKFRAKKSMEDCREEYQKLKSAALIAQRKFRATKLGKLERSSYLSLKSSAILIQQKFRARQEMRNLRVKYLRLLEVAVFVQTTFRKNQLARQCRSEYLALKHSVIHVQRCFRAVKTMRHQQKQFVELRAAAIVIQNRFRANCQMKLERRKFLQLKQSALKIQNLFRAKITAESCRKEFLLLKATVGFVQRRYREKKQLQKDRNEFLELKTAAVQVQRRYRAKKVGQECAAHYSKLKSATLFIQHRFRELRQAKLEREKYLRLRSAVVLIQQKFRGRKLMRVEMERYQETLKNKRELLAVRASQQRKHVAAVKIQALWRGFRARKDFELPNANQLESRRITNVISVSSRQNVKHLTLQNRYDNALSDLLSAHTDLQDAIMAFMNLDTITYLSPKLCLELVKKDLIQLVYRHLQAANRSEPYQELCVAALRVLINLARYKATSGALWTETESNNGVTILLCFFKAYFEKNPTLCCHAGTLLWLFADDPVKAKIIRDNVLCRKTMILIHDNLLKKRQRPNPKLKQKTATKIIPSKTADWGLGNRTKVFDDPLLCVSELCKKIEIPVNNFKQK